MSPLKTLDWSVKVNRWGSLRAIQRGDAVSASAAAMVVGPQIRLCASYIRHLWIAMALEL